MLVSTIAFWVQALSHQASTTNQFRIFLAAAAQTTTTTSTVETKEAAEEGTRNSKGKDDVASLIPVRNDFISPTDYRRSTTPEEIWQSLLKEGSEMPKSIGSNNGSSNEKDVVLEVGMHILFQCRLAAEHGFDAHCVEPSPVNYKRVRNAFRTHARKDATLRDRIHLYNVAAGSETNQTVHFLSSGSTGDQVLTAEQAQNSSAKEYIVKVPTMRMDDLLRPFSRVFLAKIDTQGFEPAVVDGMQELIARQKVDYLLMEYWPRGMDKLSGRPRCESAIEMLTSLAQAGYTLYQLGVAWHPKEPFQTTNASTRSMLLLQRPFDNIVNNCNWFYELEEKVPIQIMGYWTDVLAVSPQSRLPEDPSTQVGKILLAGRKKYHNTSVGGG